MREEISEDEIFKEYTGTQGRVRIRNLETDGEGYRTYDSEFWESLKRKRI